MASPSQTSHIVSFTKTFLIIADSSILNYFRCPRAPDPRDRRHLSVTVAIETLEVLRGSLSPRTLALVTEWAALHRAELKEDWALARAESQLNPIAPLE